MSDKSSEAPEMSAVEFTSYALRNHVAPPGIGSVKARLRHAARTLGWAPSRVRDAWYADDRMAIRADEIRQIERKTGLQYGRAELRTNQELIDSATAILGTVDPDFHGPFIAAIRALAGAFNRTGIEGRE